MVESRPGADDGARAANEAVDPAHGVSDRAGPATRVIRLMDALGVPWQSGDMNAHLSSGEARPSRAARGFLLVSGTIRLALQAAAVVSIVRRRPEAINGPKWLWLLISCIGFAGPIAYLLGGRKIGR